MEHPHNSRGVASDSSTGSSGSDEEGYCDDDHHHNVRGDDNDDSNNDHHDQKHMVTDRPDRKTMMVESPSSHDGTPRAASTNAGGGTTTNSQQLASSESLAPNRKDVLLGRGRPYQNFGGNKRMLRIVSRYKEEYAARPRDQKRLFVETVLDAVLKDGTRFLRRVDESEDGSSDQWEEVDRTTAADKVWHALRSKDRSMKSKDKRKGSHQEGDGDDESFFSRSSRIMKNEELRHDNHRHNLLVAVSNDTTSSSDVIGGLINQNDSSKPLQERRSAQERDRTSSVVAIPPTIESLTRDIVHHLNRAVEATNLLSALLGAPALHLPTASSLPLTMLAEAPETGANHAGRGGLAAAHRGRDNSACVEEVARMNQNALFLPGAGSSLGASAHTPVSNQMLSAPLLPFSSLAGLAPSPAVAQYLSTTLTSNNAGALGGVVAGAPSVVPATFLDARQIAQMAALYPRLFSSPGGNVPPANGASSLSNNQLASTTPATFSAMAMDRSQQILIQALATLSQQAAQYGNGQPPGPPR